MVECCYYPKLVRSRLVTVNVSNFSHIVTYTYICILLVDSIGIVSHAVHSKTGNVLLGIIASVAGDFRS